MEDIQRGNKQCAISRTELGLAATNAPTLPTKFPTNLPIEHPIQPSFTPINIPSTSLPTTTSTINNEPTLIVPNTQPSTSITCGDAIELAERQPPQFCPPKQPPPDQDTMGVGLTAEGFAALQRVLRGATYCLPHFRGCQWNHNISREGVLDIGYLLHPGKVLGAWYSRHIADSLVRIIDWYVDRALARM